MIAKAKSISHGHANLAYIMGESKKKEHAGEKIQFVAVHGLDPFHRSAEAWEEIKRACRDHPDMKNTVIRLILSPDKKDTEDFTLDDWAYLWDEFLEVFDTLDHRDYNGRLISKPTNLRNSIHTVHVHFDSKSDVPHLHGAVCRVDENGRTNHDSNIHLRAQAAAEIINMRRGWESPKKIRDRQIRNLNALCKDILRRMPRYSLSEFHFRLRAAGYEVIAKPDSKGEFHGHSIKKGNCHYKMSGIGREFTISRLSDTWRKLHKADTAQLTPKTATSTKSSVATKPKPVTSEASHFPNYTVPKTNCRPYEIERNGKNQRYYLPAKVVDLFDNEFNYREISNSDEMVRTAVSLFIGVLLPPEARNVGTGGGGSDSDLPWGHNPKEDEIEWARRCAQMAKQITRPQQRTKFRR